MFASNKSQYLRHLSLSWVLWVFWCTNSIAGDEDSTRYYRLNLLTLEYTDGSFANVRSAFRKNLVEGRLLSNDWRQPPYVQLHDGGEFYPVDVQSSFEALWEQAEYVLRVPHAKKVKGAVHWFVGAGQVVKLSFELDPSDAREDHHDVYWQRRAAYYQYLMWERRLSAGSAWFRHQYRESMAQIDKRPASEEFRQQFQSQQRFRNELNNERTFALVTGGRAISENLQLFDPLFVLADQQRDIEVRTLEGITIREYDWQALVEGKRPKKDNLASAIPFDQHAVFFRSFQGVVDLVDQMKSQGSDFIMLANAGAQDAETRKFYERQMCLSLDTATRLLGSQMIKSVALTGGDLYLRTGSDVALVLEPTPAGEKALLPLLVTQIAAKAKQHPDAKAVTGSHAGVSYSGFVTDDRQISTYVTAIDGNVVVTNSLSQLASLQSAAHGTLKSLAELDEFTFFRDRYSIETPEETAFVFISDATIRRWCGPRWRIATARRTRAVAKMAELQAINMDSLVRGNVETMAVTSELNQIDAGNLRLTSSGIQSDIYGSLEFQTPISEMDVEEVSKAEAEGYRRWREGYQSRWRNFFDPIGIQVSLEEGVFASDVSVMPLIAGSDYGDLIELSQGVLIGEESGDPHKEAIGHFVLSLNHESNLLRELNSMAGSFAPGLQVNIFNWIGDSVSIYADADPFWNEWIEVAGSSESGRGFDSRESVNFLEKNLGRLPVALRVEVASGFKLGLFLAALRGFAESAAPGLLRWETLKHSEQPYVAISPAAIDSLIPEDFRIYYLATGKQLLFTFHKEMVQRAIDREKARANGTAKEEDKANWYGSNLGIKVTEQMKHLYMPLIEQEMPEDLRRMSWDNLPILDEWKKRYPDRDPVEVHQQHWQRKLLCPGGGKYVWNEETQQMESTVFGSPVNPKMPEEAPVPKILRNLKAGEFGLSFEDDGLRAKVRLELRK